MLTIVLVYISQPTTLIDIGRRRRHNLTLDCMRKCYIRVHECFKLARSFHIPRLPALFIPIKTVRTSSRLALVHQLYFEVTPHGSCDKIARIPHLVLSKLVLPPERAAEPLSHRQPIIYSRLYRSLLLYNSLSVLVSNHGIPYVSPLGPRLAKPLPPS